MNLGGKKVGKKSGSAKSWGLQEPQSSQSAWLVMGMKAILEQTYAFNYFCMN